MVDLTAAHRDLRSIGTFTPSCLDFVRPELNREETSRADHPESTPFPDQPLAGQRGGARRRTEIASRRAAAGNDHSPPPELRYHPLLSASAPVRLGRVAARRGFHRCPLCRLAKQ